MKSKYTLSALATAAAVAFGGVAIAQVSSGENTADTSVSASANASDSNMSTNGSLSNSDRIGDNDTNGSLDTRTMGAPGTGLDADANADADLNMNSDTGSDDLLSPQADRG